jgi:hypothetical protein
MVSDRPRSVAPTRRRFAGAPVPGDNPIGVLTDVSETFAALTSAVRLRATSELRGYEPGLGNTPFVGIFVFLHGQWSDLPSAFAQAYVQGELTNREYIDYLFADPQARVAIGTVRPQLVEDPQGNISPEYAIHRELAAILARLSAIEERIERRGIDPVGVEGQKRAAKEEQARGERTREDDPENGERLNVKPPVVDATLIASEVQSFGITETSAWKDISKLYPGASLFAIDADPRSFQVSGKGAFDGRANVLLTVPTKLRSGRASTYSIAIQSRVYGRLSPTGKIQVSEFKIA